MTMFAVKTMDGLIETTSGGAPFTLYTAESRARHLRVLGQRYHLAELQSAEVVCRESEADEWEPVNDPSVIP